MANYVLFWEEQVPPPWFLSVFSMSTIVSSLAGPSFISLSVWLLCQPFHGTPVVRMAMFINEVNTFHLPNCNDFLQHFHCFMMLDKLLLFHDNMKSQTNGRTILTLELIDASFIAKHLSVFSLQFVSLTDSRSVLI